MRSTAFTLLMAFITITCGAQQLKHSAFTVNDGLPSNNVYRCIEDDKGFLWVATDAGIARFDGKHFQTFTGREGLPDNEVLAVVKEGNGRIWVNCFKQSPAYFDDVQNKFINSKENPVLAKVKEGTGIRYCFLLQNNGVMFANSAGSFIFRDNELMSYRRGAKGEYLFVKGNNDGSVLMYGSKDLDPLTHLHNEELYLVKNNTYLDSATIGTFVNNILPGINRGILYLFEGSRGKCTIYNNIGTNPIRYRMDSVIISEPFNNFEFTPPGFYLLGISGKIYLFDQRTLKQRSIISGDYLPNSMYDDTQGNLWVSTINKGLLLYQKKRLEALAMPDGFKNTDFLSLATKPDGTLLAGNFYGQILEVTKNGADIKSIPKTGLVSRQRKILMSQGKIFTFSEMGIFVNYTQRLKGTPPPSFNYAKTAAIYNDSIILVGQSTGMQRLNTITESFKMLNSHRKRVTALTTDVDGMVYFGSTDGLYKYIYKKDSTVELTKRDLLFSERVMALCATPDKLLWDATSGDGVVVVKDDKVLLHISENQGIINNASRSITAGRPGQVWLGTAGGISIINYMLKGGKVTYTIQNLSISDGLSNNAVNEMLYRADTVYAATGDGISVIPANISIPKFNIPVHLVGMSINQRDTILKSAYKLAYYQQNIQMQFAGVELYGHFKKFQYTIDKNKNWINLDQNILTVELSSGSHTIQVRAVDVNNNVSNKVLTINFNIATPFWKAIWFWLILAITTQIVIIYFINRRQKKRRGANLAKQIAGVQTAALEQQAFTSLMNPHFMFNALNSIQHYINVQDRQNANRYLSDFASLIRKNFEAAQLSFIPLEQELENIKIYLRLEQMRFNERFTYQLIIDDTLDTDDWMIPTMVLQPLLENALLHGLMPSAINGTVTISLQATEADLCITITDNGIGVKNSLALNAGSSHKSRGTELIKKRIAALSRFGNSAITIQIAPAFISEKNPGNKITLVVPHGLHKAWLLAQ